MKSMQQISESIFLDKCDSTEMDKRYWCYSNGYIRCLRITKSGEKVFQKWRNKTEGLKWLQSTI